MENRTIDEPIQVECYAGAMGDETPRAVVQGHRRREVTAVSARWIEEGMDPAGGRHRWYRVTFHDGSNATLYRDLALEMWFLHGPGVTGHDEPPGIPRLRSK